MLLNKNQIELIDYSWDIICENPKAMMKFYDHLFKISPETIHFFPDDLSKQSEKLAYTLGFIVGNLDRLEQIQEAVYDLGRFHNQLEIEAHHYQKLKVALNYTIKEVMEEKYDDKIGDAWNIVLDFLSELMISAPQKKKSNVKFLIKKLFSIRSESSYHETF